VPDGKGEADMAITAVLWLVSRDTLDNFVCNKPIALLVIVACLAEREKFQRIRFPGKRLVYIDDMNPEFLCRGQDRIPFARRKLGVRISFPCWKINEI